MSAAFELYWTKRKGGQASKRKQSDKKRIEFLRERRQHHHPNVCDHKINSSDAAAVSQAVILFMLQHTTKESSRKGKISFLSALTQKNSTQNRIECMTVRGLLSRVRSRYNILNFPALFLALVGLPFCPPGRYCSTASAEKSAGKFKMLYRVLTLRFFLLKCML